MSQHFSIFPPDLLQKLKVDIFKFRQFGAPEFRLNITCKHGEHCKYSKFSCKYSHETLCKFQKNGRKCLNTSCTYNHALPMEYQLAQAFFNKIMQFPSVPDSFEASNLTSETIFQQVSAQKAAHPINAFLHPKLIYNLSEISKMTIKLRPKLQISYQHTQKRR